MNMNEVKKDAEVFWNEFLLLKDRLMDIDSLNDKEADKLLITLDKKLKKYSSGLDFVLGDLTSKGRTFTVTANGDEKYFPFLEELMDYAPEINLWKIEGFLPAEGKHCTMKYGGYTLRSWEMYFVPLENEEEQSGIGLRIAVNRLIDKDDFKVCAYLLIEKMIGEYYAAKLIKYFDVVKLPETWKEENYMPLDNLPDYIVWVANGIKMSENEKK
ncbi:MAG: hypothetical protein IJ748_03660 [Bacteroidales bacterium]|nr:hypothetical protein [Bacteroidales bacterium]